MVLHFFPGLKSLIAYEATVKATATISHTNMQMRYLMSLTLKISSSAALHTQVYYDRVIMSSHSIYSFTSA